MKNSSAFFCLAVLVVGAALFGGKLLKFDSPVTQLPNPSAAKPKQDNQPGLRILFIGNSHAHPIPKVLSEIFKRKMPDAKVDIQRATAYGFLVDHAKNKSTLKKLDDGKWDFVVLQAQKYSTSGKYTYSTAGAIQLATLAKEKGAKVLMFPEWSRKSVPDEYKRIRKIHDSIAEQTGVSVAPIGEAWQLALKENKALKLYASDGNHASGLGSYLNACVFFAVLTGDSPERPATKKESKRDQQLRLIEQAAAKANSKRTSK